MSHGGNYNPGGNNQYGAICMYLIHKYRQMLSSCLTVTADDKVLMSHKHFAQVLQRVIDK